MTRACFFFFRASRKSSEPRWLTSEGLSSQDCSGGGGACGLQRQKRIILIHILLEYNHKWIWTALYKSPKVWKCWESSPIGDLELHHSLVHELDDLVFTSELWQRVLLLAFHKVFQTGEAGDLVAISHRLVHGGVHCCQHTGTLEKHQTTNPKSYQLIILSN